MFRQTLLGKESGRHGLGTKNVWKMLCQANLISKELFDTAQRLALSNWTPALAKKLYTYIAKQKVYITNFAKCTQIDARPLKNKVFNEYRELLLKEIKLIRPKKIVTFGNLVSSLLLQKPIKVSEYTRNQHETLKIGSLEYLVYPTFYPVGQGMRNMKKAIKRVTFLLK